MSTTAQVVVKTRPEITGVDSTPGRAVAVNLGSNFEQPLRELPFGGELDIRTCESKIKQDTARGPVDAFVMDRVSSTQVASGASNRGRCCDLGHGH